MDRRRLTGLVALVFAIIVIVAVTYFDAIQNRSGGPESFPPAMSADESVPPEGAPIVPPVSLTGGEAAAPATTTAEAPASGGTTTESPAPATETAKTEAGAPATAVTTAEPPAAAEAKPADAAAPAATTAAAPPSDAAAPQTAASQPPAAATENPAPAATADNAAAPVMTEAKAPAAETAPATAGQGVATAPGAAPQTLALAEPPPTMAAPEAKQPDVAAPAPAPAAEAPMPVVPTFDVVRVEPTGDTVVAGLSEPGAKVEILDGMQAIAAAEANDRGEWALVLDEALEPGPHDLAVRTTTKDGGISTLSDQRVAVSVPERGSKDVLVVLNAPDGPSRVLQVPAGEPAAPAAGPQVAAAPGAGAATTEAAPQTMAAAPEAAAGGAAPATAGQQVAAAEPPAAATPAPAQGQAPAMAETKPPETAAPAAGGAAAPSGPAVAVAAPPAEPAKPAEPPKPEPEVVVAAVEADTAGMLYVAGTAKTPEPVRVYLGDDVIGEATPSPSGTWLVEAHREVPPGGYQVRVDQINVGDGAVIARAEVPFEREIEVATMSASGSAGSGGAPEVRKTGAEPEVVTVIIKRGDNLWRIARSNWGKGVRWSSVYQANKDQIRNPHWIYPGQVFVMPILKDTAEN